ncbi:hypothetical protein ABZS66_56485 [Dactylosporangium sp. NPDC005572]|uniref:hypothetical protein n=1 Tax=Dactylosporangium sp. NPDC005572 TaxID=3156889 RepID=UPI0033A76B0F
MEQHRARWLLPPVFATVLRRSWVELDVDRDLRFRLVVAESPAGDATRLERLVTRQQPTVPRTPEVVATLPGQAAWPLPTEPLTARARAGRIRTSAALLVAAVALLSVVSAVTAPLRGRLAALLEILPVAAPQAAATAVVFVSAFLLLISWGLHRGRSLAWAVAVVLLTATALLHLLKGLDVEEAVVTLFLAGWLARNRTAFPAHPDHRQARRAAYVLATGGVITAALTAVLVAGTRVRGSTGHTAAAIAERIAGRNSLPLSYPFITPALIAAGSV